MNCKFILTTGKFVLLLFGKKNILMKAWGEQKHTFLCVLKPIQADALRAKVKKNIKQLKYLVTWA